MRRYLVTWEIEIDAESPDAAAREALKIQRDPNSLAVIFDVQEFEGEAYHVDLLDDDLME